MKKYLALIFCIAVLLIGGTILISAAPAEQQGFWIEDAVKSEEILAGEAGERDIVWNVPFLHIAPKLDGEIGKNEYIPFEEYEDYIAWMANSVDATTGQPSNSVEEFQEFYDATQDGFFEAYWGWDGNYLYLAFDVNLVNGFTCTPEKLGGDMFLWAYNCLQVGIASVDATGRDPSYVELGFGVHSETNESITANWAGSYLPTAGEDFIGYYDATNQKLRYELRIHLQSALGLTDRTVENGDQINFAWLLSCNGESTGAHDTWQIAFCHGIGGPYSGKENRYFARITFADKPDGLDIPIVELPGMSEEDKEYALREFIDLSDEKVAGTFEGENAAVEYVTEGETSFLRITSLATENDYPFAYSTKYPTNLVGGLGDYIVVKYRTSSPEGEDLGIVFRNIYATEHDPENCYIDTIGNDGEWHTMIFYMSGEANWQHFILNIGLVPFAYSSNSAQETIDIAWIKIYQNDPTEIYENDFYDPDAGEDESTDESGVGSEAGSEAGSEGESQPADSKPVESTPVESDSTKDSAAESDSAKDSAAESESKEEEKKSGCGATVLGSVAVLMAAAAAAVVLKKKED